MENAAWRNRALSPYGLEVAAVAASTPVDSIGAPVLKNWIAAHRYVLLRGFTPMLTDSMMQLARSLGDPLEWEFGAINELVAKPDAKNYIYTTGAVPFHWDGAFVGKIPHYILFSCEVAPPENGGGETLFCDGNKIIQDAAPHQLALWKATFVTYSCDRIVHYGGSFTSPMIARHPVSGEETLRFAEPVHDLNPVALEIPTMTPSQRDALIAEMSVLLRKPEYCVAHAWRAGDVLVADNHALLHGRNAFVQPGLRHIRRINIL